MKKDGQYFVCTDFRKPGSQDEYYDIDFWVDQKIGQARGQGREDAQGPVQTACGPRCHVIFQMIDVTEFICRSMKDLPLSSAFLILMASLSAERATAPSSPLSA